ncbi:hypothetical protein [Alkalibacillus silvisoli]|uniref:Helix-turn-helix domain-containing protein n=1 Tax=Alkalibacillus silvisoli TaxID=392823 RepID=A0ABP3K3V8_9BACI
METLIFSSAKDLLVYYELESKDDGPIVAKSLVEEYSRKIRGILDYPHGGTLAPEEIAEIRFRLNKMFELYRKEVTL